MIAGDSGQVCLVRVWEEKVLQPATEKTQSGGFEEVMRGSNINRSDTGNMYSFNVAFYGFCFLSLLFD